jgi:hypothetical protein
MSPPIVVRRRRSPLRDETFIPDQLPRWRRSVSANCRCTFRIHIATGRPPGGGGRAAALYGLIATRVRLPGFLCIAVLLPRLRRWEIRSPVRSHPAEHVVSRSRPVGRLTMIHFATMSLYGYQTLLAPGFAITATVPGKSARRPSPVGVGRADLGKSLKANQKGLVANCKWFSRPAGPNPMYT